MYIKARNPESVNIKVPTLHYLACSTASEVCSERISHSFNLQFLHPFYPLTKIVWYLSVVLNKNEWTQRWIVQLPLECGSSVNCKKNWNWRQLPFRNINHSIEVSTSSKERKGYKKRRLATLYF